MASQITLMCDFVFRFLRCHLPEDIIDIDLKIHMIQGVYTYKEDCDYCSNKFRPLGIHVTPFEPLKQKMAKFMRQKQVTAATATPSCSYLQQPQEMLREEVKECTIINIAISLCNDKWLPRESTCGYLCPNPIPESKHKQTY